MPPKQPRPPVPERPTPESHPALVDALAVVACLVDTTFAVSTLEAWSARLGVQDDAGRRLTHEFVSSAVRALVERGDVVRMDSTWLRVPGEHHWAILERSAADGTLRTITASLFRDDHPGDRYAYHLSGYGFGETRAALVLGRLSDASERIQMPLRYASKSEAAGIMLSVFGRDPRPEWLELLTPEGVETYVARVLDEAVTYLTPVGAEPLRRARASEDRAVAAGLARVMAMRGEPVAELGGLSKLVRAETLLFTSFMAGDLATAREQLAETFGKNPQKRRKLDGALSAVFGLTSIVASTDEPSARERLSAMVQGQGGEAGALSAAFKQFAQHQLTGTAVKMGASLAPGALWYDALALGLMRFWGGGEPQPRSPVADALRVYAERARAHGYAALARHLDQTREALSGKAPEPGSLAAAYRTRGAWEVALDALESIARDGSLNAPAPPAAKTGARIVWQVAHHAESGAVAVFPRLLTSARSRTGKDISLEKLQRSTEPYVTQVDRDVLACARKSREYASSRRSRVVEVLTLDEAALLPLIGHEDVTDLEGNPLRIVRGDGELRAERSPKGDATRLTIHPPALLRAPLYTEARTPNELVIYQRTPELERVAALLSAGAVEIPKAADERLGHVLAQMGQRVRVSAGGAVALAGKRVDAERRLAFLCRWSGERLDVRLRAIPLGLDGPLLVAGSGQAQVMALRSGEAVSTERDLRGELLTKKAIFRDAPGLEALTWTDDATVVPSLELALDFLAETGALDESLRVLAWPDGKTLPVPRAVGLEQLRVRVKQSGGQLLAAIDVAVDEERVVEFRQLIEGGGGRGRFVHLDDGNVLALSDELRRRLDSLAGMGRLGAKGLTSEPVMLPRLVELSEGAGTRTLDAATQQRLRALEDALAAPVTLPRGFGAELRDYQRDGFVWMARLAEAELGACLADDMGLGKTIQTLALLAKRASQGPALVVAPTSVIGAWLAEARRFVPKLNVTLFADERDRAGVLASAGASDVIVCSYGVLVSEAEALSEKHFATVVFDEAHALKNASTQRAKAAAGLRASFRLALTGTPVENHLGELWSLMRAIVPGLLGGERDFATRFVEPIARGEREPLTELRARLRPFLLRRTKAQVLDELPERSETTLLVTPTAEERAFYEALRRDVERRVAAHAEAKPGSARVEILAEIGRLRQAAVDPRILGGEKAPAGAKLDLLAERVMALHEEGHQALVFTQFLSSLARIEEQLRAAGLRVSTLDGSLSAKERSARVASFQAGDADVFVMSLHAGGVGVTLTAADYVFHVDPWWNPAVEDQATGRAHRIGQRRPVHVYRLITAGSIEEKIIALHGTKKQLTGDLLEGLDEAKKLDLDTLRALLEA